MNKSNVKTPTYVFLGSSVTKGHTTNDISFVEIIEKDLNCNVIKEAISGTTLVNEDNSSYISRLENKIDKNIKVDHFICQLSTNDASKGKELGEVNDSFDGDFNTLTICGAIEYIIYYVKKTYGCPISFYTNPKYNSSRYVEMINKLYEIKKKWEIGIIDFYNDNTFDSNSLKTMMSDDIHPNLLGYNWIADVMEKYLLNKD